MKRIFSIFLLLLLTACSDSPTELADRAAHFWDGTNLSDPGMTAQAKTLDTRFAAYVALLEDERIPVAISGPLLQATLARAETDTDVFRMFRELCEKYLYATDSPCRNEELYGYALQSVVASDRLDDYHKLRPRYQLNMIARNRVGELAADFGFTLPDGRQSSLHAVEAAYTILYFNNPDCSACEEVRTALTHQRLIRRLSEEGRLRVVALYTSPDEDKALWRKSLRDYPSGWITAYDDEAKIHYQGLYDLRSIPCLYLLDAGKRVLCKGASTAEPIVEALEAAVSH